MRRTIRRSGAALLAALPAALLAPLLAAVAVACGGGPDGAPDNGIGDLPGDRVARLAFEDLRAAPSVQATGTVDDGSGPVKVDFRFAGDRHAFTIDQIGRQEVVRVGPTTYIRADDEAAQILMGEQGARTLAGKWMAIPTDLVAAFADTFTTSGTPVKDLDSFVDGLDGRPFTASSAVQRVTVDGRPVVRVSAAGGAVIEVAATGPPHLLRFVQPGVPGAEYELGRYGEDLEIVEPTEAIPFPGLGG